MKLLGIPLLLVLAGCPIAPDFGPDGGADAGVDAGTTTDAGTTDAGTSSGSAGAVLTTSTSASSTTLSWSATDLARTSIDAEGSTGPSQVTVSASNGLSGTFKMTINELVPGETSENVLSLSYQPASGPDSWLCNTQSSGICTYNLSLTDYDGVTLAGNFSISFPEDGFGVSASLTSGSFSVTLE